MAVSAIRVRERLSARTLTGVGVALVGVLLVVLASGQQVKFQPIAVLIGWLWLGEHPGPLTLVGGVITVAGMALANTRRRTLPEVPPMSIPRELR